MENPEQFLTDLNEAVDEAHSRIDKLESRNKTLLLVAAGACALGAINAFFTLQAIKAIANMVNEMNQFGRAVAQHDQILRQLTGYIPGAPSGPQAQDSTNTNGPGGTVSVMESAPVAPPAEGPVSSAPAWAEKANKEEDLSDVLREVGLEE